MIDPEVLKKLTDDERYALEYHIKKSDPEIAPDTQAKMFELYLARV